MYKIDKDFLMFSHTVIAYSFWTNPQEFYCESEEEALEVARDLKNQQYKTEIKEFEG